MKTIQELLGHEDITTTEIYLHVAVGSNGFGVRSPLDGLEEEIDVGQEEGVGIGNVDSLAPVFV